MGHKDESLPVRLIKHPTIWAGTGMIIRYYDDPTTWGELMKGIGILAVGLGVAHSLATRPAVPESQTMTFEEKLERWQDKGAA